MVNGVESKREGEVNNGRARLPPSPIGIVTALEVWLFDLGGAWHWRVSNLGLWQFSFTPVLFQSNPNLNFTC